MNTQLSAEELTNEEQTAAVEVTAARDAMFREQGRAFPDGWLRPDCEETLRDAQERFRIACERHNELVQLRLAASR